ncbi:MAG: M48 family metallopeptidase [Candidatus Delongbacteria bacterium]|nr:M48 family metallopeptidase [Candidatus Delongbacteria bacterium]
MTQADRVLTFKARVRQWETALDVKIVRLAVRPMRAKWASCSTKGHLNFSTDLLHLNSKLQDYVIVHELLHLRTPNHGKLWKVFMRAHLGEYEVYEAELKHVMHSQSNP